MVREASGEGVEGVSERGGCGTHKYIISVMLAISGGIVPLSLVLSRGLRGGEWERGPSGWYEGRWVREERGPPRR